MNQPSPSEELFLYLRLLAGEPNAGQFFEIRWRTAAGGMRRRFVPVLRVHEAAVLIKRLASQTDVYVGVALREGRTHGGKSAIAGSHLLYIECDHSDTDGGLAAFEYPPTVEIASGTPGHLHLYWLLRSRARGTQVEAANRRLALALGGDPASVDIARILRPPATFNFKHDPPRPVNVTAYRADARYSLPELIAGLPDPHNKSGGGSDRSRGGRRCSPSTLDRQLLAIPPAHYARVLAGREPDRAGKIACPFHDDKRPSLQLYGDGSFYCFGCKRGGTIYDFAAHLWLSGQSSDQRGGAALRGREFLDLRERLSVRFQLNQEAHS
jgi:CHC2 zinc finger/RepB DNA-primase from phage plasmid